MFIRLGYKIELASTQPLELISMLDVHPERGPSIVDQTGFICEPDAPNRVYIDAFGNACRRISMPAGTLVLRYDVLVEDSGLPDKPLPQTENDAVSELPDEVLEYLLPSRYCETDLLMATAWNLFGNIPPGSARAKAIFDYTHQRLQFGYEHARATRTAAEAHEEQVGVCRDFAHLAITLCRCMNIPARYVNGYLGDIDVPPNPAPMDFNAWCEVYVGGGWYTLDARHNTPRVGRVVVARGRDATDIPLLHSFGPHTLQSFTVWTSEQQSDRIDAQPVE